MGQHDATRARLTDICSRYLAAFATGDADLVASFVDESFVNEDTSTVANAYTLHAHVNDRDIAVRGLLRIHVDPETGLILDRTDYWDSTVFLRQAGLN